MAGRTLQKRKVSLDDATRLKPCHLACSGGCSAIVGERQRDDEGKGCVCACVCVRARELRVHVRVFGTHIAPKSHDALVRRDTPRPREPFYHQSHPKAAVAGTDGRQDPSDAAGLTRTTRSDSRRVT